MRMYVETDERMVSAVHSSHKIIDLTIIIPAYCEEKRIGHTLDQLSKFLVKNPFLRSKNVEILVVAADARDNTKDIVQTKQVLFAHSSILQPGGKVGKGRDVQYGMLRASGRCVMFMDADLATPLNHLPDFYKLCTEGNDVVIGTRNLLTYRSDLLRGIFAWGGNLLYRIGSGIWVEDTQCGFKMFTAEAAQLCFSKQTIMEWGFDIEILAIAKANNLKIKPVRLNDWQHMPYSTYADSPLQITMRSIRDFFYVSFKQLTGSYRK